MKTRFSPVGFVRTSAIILTLLLTSAALVPAASGPNTLRAPVNTLIGSGPYSVVNGDFNGDGKLDSAAANFAGNAVGVVFGDGAGGFGPASSYLVGTQPRQIIAGLFDNNASLDLVTVNLQTANITLLLNDGSGAFTATSYAAGFAPTSVATGDFNTDGRLDLAVGSEGGNTLAILLANPGGGFAAPAITPVPGTTIRSIAVGLVNGDTNVDLVTANTASNNISVFTGNGTGIFSAPVNFSTGANTSPNYVALGDFNGDTKLDAVVTLPGPQRAGFLAGDGAGSFAAITSFSLGNGANPVQVTVKDLNGDNKLDLLTVSFNSNLLKILLGNGTGGVMPSGQELLLTNRPRAAAVGDFNGDGKIDITAVGDATGALSLLLNKGGQFEAAIRHGADPAKPLIADVNGDGRGDLVLAGELDGAAVRLGNGDGTFGIPVRYDLPQRGKDFLLTDISNDGKPDMVSSGDFGIAVRLNEGNGTFAPYIITFTTPGQLAVGDVNRDGIVDLIIGLPDNSPANVVLLQGDNAGHFVPIGSTTATGGVSRLRFADFNNDGHTDLAALTMNGRISVQLSNGVNSFTAPALIDTGGCIPQGIPAIADYNHDGKLDFAAPSICGNGANTAVFGGDGNGNFSLMNSLLLPPFQATIPPIVNPTMAADFNRDGNMDFGLVCYGEYSVAYGNGAGLFSVTKYAIGGPSVYASAGDVNGDGAADVAFDHASVFGVQGYYLMLSRPQARGKDTADFDGDGRTDISVFRPSTGIWYIIRSSDSTFYGVQFGQNGDVPVPGDYDADGKTDIAVYRPGGGVWYILRSADGSFFAAQHGTTGDIPVPADFDGNGASDIAVYRPSTGFWYTSAMAVQFGAPGDIPTQADFDGDGRADIAVFRPSAGIWYSLRTTQGFQQVSFGLNGDRPAPLDYDGDGRANIAVFRPSNATWYTSTNPATNFGAIQWGLGSDVMAPGYYDGDARADVGVYRTGDWYVLNTATPTYDHFYFGAAGDIPIPLAYIPQ